MTAPVETELKFFHCEERSSLATNGGYLSTNEVAQSAINNVWEHVLREGRENGQNDKRKLALKIHQDNGSNAAGYLASALFCIDGPTLGDDRVFMYTAGAQDTQGDITGSERKYIAAGIKNAITAGTKTITITVQHVEDVNGIAEGDEIRLTDKLTPESATGNVEYHTIDTGTLSVSGLDVTFATVNPIANDYSAFTLDGSGGSTGGKVGVIYSAGQVKASNDTMDFSGAAGDLGYDEGAYPLTFNNMGADEHRVTITIQPDGINFIAVSDRHGSLASGDLNTDYSPLHPYWNKPLFNLEAAGWTGTAQGGDVVVIDFHAAATYVWEEKVTPAGCAPISNNKVILVHRSEGL